MKGLRLPKKLTLQHQPRARASEPLRSQKGQSLVQVLVSIGLMATLTLVFATMMEHQSRETQALSEKLAAMDAEKLLIASLADGSVCSYVLGPNPTWQTFNSLGPLPQTITLTNPTAATATLYSSMMPGPVPGPIALQAGNAASPISNSLKVQSIQLKITSGAGTNFQGTWLVNFAGSVRSLKPAMASTNLTVDNTNPAAAKITGCQSNNSNSVNFGGMYGFANWAGTCEGPNIYTGACSCPPWAPVDETVLSAIDGIVMWAGHVVTLHFCHK